MISLTLQFKSGLLVEIHREATPGASPRPLRRLEGQPGLYHRILGPTGDVLFENLVPDPRRVPWDTSDDGKTLRGGVAHLEDLPVQIRLPGNVHGRLQVFEIINPNWTHSDLDKSGRIVTDLPL